MLMDYYLLFGLFVHVALLGLVDWLGYRHFMTHGYNHTLSVLLLFNVAVGFGIYYLVWLPFRRRLALHRQIRQAGRLQARQSQR